MSFDPASRAATLPPAEVPRDERLRRLSAVLRDVREGRPVGPPDLSSALLTALRVALGGGAGEEDLRRYFSLGRPAPADVGLDEAVELLLALAGPDGIVSALGLPPPARDLPTLRVLGEAASRPPAEVGPAMLRAGCSALSVSADDGTWAALYFAGRPEDVSAAIRAALPEDVKPGDLPPG